MTLGIVLLGLIVVTWIYTVFLSWKKSAGVVFAPIEESFFTERYAWFARLVRRGWYRLTLESKTAVSWSTKRAEDAFITVFPKSAVAFTKKDALTGLHQGPSSYFLKSISVSEKVPQKRLPKTKKVV